MKFVELTIILMILATVSAAKSEAKGKGSDPLIHDYIKLALWLLFGVIIGVFFEAKIQIREIIKPITEKGVTGIIIAAGIYTLFKFASYVSHYL
jgi:uncharacterized membrane protein YfcA